MLWEEKFWTEEFGFFLENDFLARVLSVPFTTRAPELLQTPKKES